MSPVDTTILILEDDVGVARLQQRRLERAGYTAVHAPNTDAALMRLRQGNVNLLVLDNHLATPGDGLAFYNQIKADGFEVPVILVTGYSDDATLIAALRAGVRDYIFKSVEYLEYLPEAVRRVLEQERVSKELANSQARLSAVIRSAQDGIVTLDERHTITSLNPAAVRIFGLPEPDVIGRSIDELLPGGLPEPGGVSDELPIEIEGWRADGTLVPLEVTAARATVSGHVICTLVLRDVTERKRASQAIAETALQREAALADLQAKTEELRSTTQQLWQAARLAGVGELAASIAHELNNPLGTVSLRIEGVLARTPPDDPRRKALEVVDQEVERMARLVSNLLLFSRPGRDRVSTVDVCAEVTKTIELTEHHLRRRGVKVVTEFASDVPSIYADRQQLRQVLLNLFTNAADAMPGGGTLTPRVRPGELVPRRPAVVVEIADTGVGIPPEVLPRVVDPFFSTKEEGKGTGLGLAICKRIVEQHKGLLQIESRVGHGTTVRATLPRWADSNVEGL